MILKKNRVLLGLSGGVDSTAAVLILKEKGFEVIGFYFDVLGTNVVAQENARKVAKQLGIKLIIDDVSDIFYDKVISNFCSEYQQGKTPNPCVMCNPNVKFKKLIEVANREEAYYIATGHYANIVNDKGVFYISRGKNEAKDQSYMLYRLSQEVLSRLIFPLGQKEDKMLVRELAREHGMMNADTKDSQEICFLPNDMNHQDYIREHGYDDIQGNFIDKDGNILGKHSGISKYTIGQRKGLGISLGKPTFVVKIDSESGDITLGSNEDLFVTQITSIDNVFTNPSFDIPKDGVEIQAKIRYASRPSKARIIKENNEIITVFEEGQRAATPGQSIVFYKDDKVIGGGFIK